jgi:hypothetical protein
MRSHPAYLPLLLLWSATAATDVTAATSRSEDGSRRSIVRPQRISFQDLLRLADDKEAALDEKGVASSHELLFWQALETDGFVSITDVFGTGNNDSKEANDDDPPARLRPQQHRRCRPFDVVCRLSARIVGPLRVIPCAALATTRRTNVVLTVVLLLRSSAYTWP